MLKNIIIGLLAIATIFLIVFANQKASMADEYKIMAKKQEEESFRQAAVAREAQAEAEFERVTAENTRDEAEAQRLLTLAAVKDKDLVNTYLKLQKELEKQKAFATKAMEASIEVRNDAETARDMAIEAQEEAQEEAERQAALAEEVEAQVMYEKEKSANALTQAEARISELEKSLKDCQSN